MLVVVSPAKRLDWSPVDGPMSAPDFQKEASTLASHARQLSLGKLKALMGLSDDLARLNRDRFQAFEDAPGEETQCCAMYAFAGDTYQGLDARTMDAKTVAYAQENLRILSGLYGVLRPLDAIQPYRLEMGSRLKTRRGTNLYQFWRDVPARALNDAGEASGTEFLVNCASQEYFGAVDRKRLKLQVIEAAFYEVANGTPKMISFFAKRARGALARYIVEHRVRDMTALQGFDTDGYRFDAEQSSADRVVFTRPATT